MSNGNHFGDIIFIDEEHQSSTDQLDQPVPMSLEKTESARDKMDHMVHNFSPIGSNS